VTTALGRMSRVRRLAAQLPQGARQQTGPGRGDRRRRGVTPAAASPRLLKALRRLVVAYGPLTAALGIAAVLDPRTLMGEPVWVKPLKFSVSIGLNGAALLWLVTRSPATPFVRGAALLSALGLVVEQALIMLQAARGVRSHFNTGTAFDGAVFAGMGASLVAGVGVATVALAVVFVLRPPQDPVLARVARSGLGLLLLGFVVGAVMLARGGHLVGAADGGPGLPLVGWSTVAGDLRPAHFVGLHGLQALIVVAHVLRHVPVPTRLAILRTLTWGVAGLVAALTGQALAGAPVLSASSALVAVATAAATGAGARSARRPAQTPVVS